MNKNNSQKEERIKKFEELSSIQEIIPEVFQEKAVFMQPSQINKRVGLKASTVSVQEGNVISVMQNLENAAVLIFASAKNPGGGVTRGSVAQEEEISLHSTWYFQVKDNKDFYLEKGESALNTDNILYVENGFLLKDENFNDIAPVKVSFIGACAPNLKGLNSQGIKVNEDDLYKIFEKRMESVLSLAEMKKKKILVLGAWGCGVFGLDSFKVANIFKKKIEEGFFSGEIIFSILGQQMAQIFQQVITPENNFKPKKPK